MKEKLDEELHSIARPLEELAPGDSYFVKIQGILAIKNELENIPLSGTQRDMLLAMENVLEQAWTFRNTPVPDRCMNPENISEVVYYFLQDKGAEYRAGLLYDRAKAEFDTRMEEIAALPPKEILEHAYEKVIKEEFLGELEQGLDEWETDTLLTCPSRLRPYIRNGWTMTFLFGTASGERWRKRWQNRRRIFGAVCFMSMESLPQK